MSGGKCRGKNVQGEMSGGKCLRPSGHSVQYSVYAKKKIFFSFDGYLVKKKIFFLLTVLLVGLVPPNFRTLRSLLSGSLALEALLIGVHCKKRYSGVVTYGALGHVPPRVSEILCFLYSAAAASLTVKTGKLPKKNIYYIFVYVPRNTLKQSQNTKEIQGRERVEIFLLCPLTSFPGDATEALYKCIDTIHYNTILASSHTETNQRFLSTYRCLLLSLFVHR